MNSIINKYLVAGFLKTIFNFFLVFVCLGVILNLFEEIEFFKNLNIGLGLPFLLTTMFIPNLILIKLLPFIIFFSSMWFLLSIRTNSDLLSLKVFGYSNLKIIFILSTTAFLFGLVIIIAVNPVTSTMVKYYEKTKAKYSRDIDHLVSINKNHLDENLNIVDLIVLSKLESSKSEIRRLIKGNGIKINNEMISDEKLLITKKLFKEKYIKLSLGKKRHIKIELS